LKSLGQDIAGQSKLFGDVQFQAFLAGLTSRVHERLDIDLSANNCYIVGLGDESKRFSVDSGKFYDDFSKVVKDVTNEAGLKPFQLEGARKIWTGDWIETMMISTCIVDVDVV
jgi:hypothetical protein